MIHNQLSRGAFLSAIKNALGGAKGEGAIERFSETIGPIIDVWSLPEWAFLRDERLGAAQENRNADAANLGFVGIRNPTPGAGEPSTLLVTVDDIWVVNANAAAQQFFVSVSRDGTPLLANQAPGRVRDLRYAPPLIVTGRTSVLSGDGVEAATTWDADLLLLTVPGNSVFHVTDFPVILKPGSQLGVNSVVINQTVRATFAWRERTAFAGELE